MDIDAQVRGLLPLETFRSAWVPTRRFGRDAVVAIAAPSRLYGDLTTAPAYWFAAAPDFSTLLAFARTDVADPVTGFVPAAVPQVAATMRPKEAHAALWRSSGTLWPAFFAGRTPEPGPAAEASAALEATVPARLLPWLRLCCGDYLSWLEGDA